MCYQYANTVWDYTTGNHWCMCVDTKLRGIEATWVVSGDRGRARTNYENLSGGQQTTPLISCPCVYENT